jgi:hypothetical protein
VLSGASISNSRIRIPPTWMVSPSRTCADPSIRFVGFRKAFLLRPSGLWSPAFPTRMPAAWGCTEGEASKRVTTLRAMLI